LLFVSPSVSLSLSLSPGRPLVRECDAQDGRTLLLDAVEHAHIDAVVELLAAGADPSDGGAASTLSPLTAAACVFDASRSRQLVLLLRRAGADVHAPDRAMRTAVEYARRLEGSSRPGGDLAIAELEAPLAEPELPKNWSKAVDDALGGTPYYFHIVTKEVRWTLPPPELSGLVLSA
jgi:ankyrin repeat protein